MSSLRFEIAKLGNSVAACFFYQQTYSQQGFLNEITYSQLSLEHATS